MDLNGNVLGSTDDNRLSAAETEALKNYAASGYGQGSLSLFGINYTFFHKGSSEDINIFKVE